MVQVLESMLVSFMQLECGSFLLQGKVNEACRAGLQDSLVERVHGRLCIDVDPVIMQRLSTRFLATGELN